MMNLFLTRPRFQVHSNHIIPDEKIQLYDEQAILKYKIEEAKQKNYDLGLKAYINEKMDEERRIKEWKKEYESEYKKIQAKPKVSELKKINSEQVLSESIEFESH